MTRGNLRDPLIYFLMYPNLRKGTTVFYCTWRMIIGCPVEYPQMSRGCHESCHCLLLAYVCVYLCVCERENGRSARERESRRRGMHVSGGTLIRSDSSITGSYTCDKSGTRSLGERRLKAVKMEFEWHPGDRVCIYDLISTFLSDSTLPRSQFCVTAPSFVKFYPELEVYRIRDLSVGNCLEEGTVTSLANSYKCNNSPTNCTSNPTQK